MEIKKNLRSFILFLGLVVAFVAMALISPAQSHEGYIYGKVYAGKTTYIGPLRWGTEEVFWTDQFNASKKNNDYEKLVPEKEEEKVWWASYNWDFSSIWENKGTVHQFTCQFGNLKEIINKGHDNFILKLKNGGEMEVDGSGYNDLEGSVHILDEELGVVKIDWGKIQRIEFIPTPEKLDQVFGHPVYGTVQGGRKESFTGFIIWDDDERLTIDKLDGDSNDGNVSIKFSDIAEIEKNGDGCDVILKSGRRLFMDDSNDVDGSNRGVSVVSPEYGIIKFSWRAFRKVTFTTTPVTGQSYTSFAAPKPIEATISLLDGDELTGRIIYDIDETLDCEMVEGKENDIEYQIPIRNIARITPKNFDYSLIELKSGKSILLGGSRDVSDQNSGLLVFVKGKKDPKHIAWKKVNEIIFK